MEINNHTGKEEYIEYEDGTRILLDADDSPPLQDGETLVPISKEEALPPAFLKAMEEGRVGRPQLDAPKKAISLRLDPDIIAAFKASGKGWQTRINDTLRDNMPE